MKEVVPLASEELRSRIRQTYYIQYLRDVILAGVIDDAVTATINSFVIYNQMDIVALVRRDSDVLQQLVRQMLDPDDPDSSFLDKLQFLHELCTLTKVCNLAGRVELYGLLHHVGVFQVLELALRRKDITIRTIACEVINLCMAHNVNILRQYVLGQSPPAAFLLVLVDGVCKEADLGLKSQFAGILQTVLETEGMEKVNCRDQMLNLWYEYCMPRLVEPLGAPIDQEVKAKEYVMELLEFCIRSHEYRIKYFVLGNGIVYRVCKLMEHRERFLQLSAVRLFRTILQIKDPFFERHLLRHKFIDSVMELWSVNGGANNLIDSAILEMLHFIKATPLREVASDLVRRHRNALLSVKYVKIGVELVALVDSWETESSVAAAAAASRTGGEEASSRKRVRGGLGDNGGGDDDWFEGGGDDELVGPDSSPLSQDSGLNLLDFHLPSVGKGDQDDDDDDDDAPLPLHRNNTPPLTFDLGSDGVVGVGSVGPSSDTFSSLRLPLESGALVAGLAAEATRLVAEASAGGAYWDSRLDSPPSGGVSSPDDPQKRRKVDVGSPQQRLASSPPHPPPPPPPPPPPAAAVVTSLLDEFLRDVDVIDGDEPKESIENK